jgi:hypothetical protein
VPTEWKDVPLRLPVPMFEEVERLRGDLPRERWLRQAVADKIERDDPPVCERCGLPYGRGYAHGPGFCLDVRAEQASSDDTHPEPATSMAAQPPAGSLRGALGPAAPAVPVECTCSYPDPAPGEESPGCPVHDDRTGGRAKSDMGCAQIGHCPPEEVPDA